jgi:adenine-specific DNA methylase
MGKEQPSEAMLIRKPSARSKEYTLMEPMTNKPEDLEKLLRGRGIDPVRLEVEDRPSSSVDLLHMMEYVARSRGNPQKAFEELRAEYPGQYSTAIALARTLIRALPEEDVEKSLCRDILLYTG